jgi:hypothetical protein
VFANSGLLVCCFENATDSGLQVLVSLPLLLFFSSAIFLIVKNRLFTWLRVNRFIKIVGVKRMMKIEINKNIEQRKEFRIMHKKAGIKKTMILRPSTHLIKKASAVIKVCKTITNVKFEFKI